MPDRSLHARILLLALLLGVHVVAVPPRVAAAELQERTSLAYAEFVEEVRRSFLSRVEAAVVPPRPEPAEGVLFARPAREDGIISLPGGLVHNWTAGAVIPRVTLQEVLAVSQSFANYSNIYESVIASRLLGRSGDTFRVLMRIREGGGGITAVLDIRSTVTYSTPSGRVAYSMSSSEEIREVSNPGERDERLLPPGRDSGYLWRANTFTRFVGLPDGVYVEMETVGLSRRFPPLLGWIIEPIARRLGRKSVEQSLTEFVVAMKRR